MNIVIERIARIGLVPVASFEDKEKAAATAKALYNGSIDCIEVTFRTSEAEDAIRNIKKNLPEMLVGAGTVLTLPQLQQAISAGADFIVTPGYNSEVVNVCIEKNIPIIPGCMDTFSIEMALGAGLDVVKFFPAEAMGGVKFLKALNGPYKNLKYIPTGGIGIKNLKDYFGFEKVLACGGSWMVDSQLIQNNEFEKITELSREATSSLLNFKLKKSILQIWRI